jgi:hypothetical protein
MSYFRPHALFVGSRWPVRVTRLSADRRLPAVALAPDRPNEGLANVAERLAQLADLESEGVVGDRHIRPDALHDLFPREQAAGVVQKQEQQLPALVGQRDLRPVAQQSVTDGVVQERPESVCHVRRRDLT